MIFLGFPANFFKQLTSLEVDTATIFLILLHLSFPFPLMHTSYFILTNFLISVEYFFTAF